MKTIHWANLVPIGALLAAWYSRFLLTQRLMLAQMMLALVLLGTMGGAWAQFNPSRIAINETSRFSVGYTSVSGNGVDTLYRYGGQLPAGVTVAANSNPSSDCGMSFNQSGNRWWFSGAVSFPLGKACQFGFNVTSSTAGTYTAIVGCSDVQTQFGSCVGTSIATTLEVIAPFSPPPGPPIVALVSGVRVVGNASVPADGRSQIVLEAFAHNPSSGLPLVGIGVNFTGGPYTFVGGMSRCVTGSDGRCRVSLVSNVAGRTSSNMVSEQYVVYGSIPLYGITGQTANFEFTPASITPPPNPNPNPQVVGDWGYYPNTIPVNEISQYRSFFRLTSGNTGAISRYSGTLPAGVSFAQNMGVFSSCPGLAFHTSGSSWWFDGYATIPVGGDCRFQFNVTSNTPGAYSSTYTCADVTLIGANCGSTALTSPLTVTGNTAPPVILPTNNGYFPDRIAVNQNSTYVSEFQTGGGAGLPNTWSKYSGTLPAGADFARNPNASSTCLGLSFQYSGKTWSFTGSATVYPGQKCHFQFDVVGTIPGSYQTPTSCADLTISGPCTVVPRNSPLTVTAGSKNGGVRVVTNDQAADGIAKDVLDVHVYTNNDTNSAYQSKQINFTWAGGSTSCLTNIAGGCQANITSTIAGRIPVTVTLAEDNSPLLTAHAYGGVSYQSAPIDVNFIAPGSFDPLHSGVKVKQDNALADGLAYDELEAFIGDGAGRPVSGVDVNFGVTLDVEFAGVASGNDAICRTNASGTCSVRATSLRDSVRFSTVVTANGSLLSGSFNGYTPSPARYTFKKNTSPIGVMTSGVRVVGGKIVAGDGIATVVLEGFARDAVSGAAIANT
ncbi:MULTISPECIES: hypothetical protein, partial [unclassified Undibacterium]